jgi:hypothetical protein
MQIDCCKLALLKNPIGLKTQTSKERTMRNEKNYFSNVTFWIY